MSVGIAPAATGSVSYGEHLIQYSIRRQANRKSGRVAIHVDPDGCVLVDAPENASDRQIRTAVTRRARWIHSHLVAIRIRRAHVLPREYVSGESVLYLGRRYRLKVVARKEAPAGVRIRGGYIEVSVSARKPEIARDALNQWYRTRARLVFAERLEAMAASLHWIRTTPVMRLQSMKIQWGSCSPAGKLTLNPQLIKAPRECIDYVLLHELCHLKEHNHSPKFYRLLDRYLPQWRRKKDRLDELADVVLNT
jgi:predicted metal-dependent hydrolase